MGPRLSPRDKLLTLVEAADAVEANHDSRSPSVCAHLPVSKSGTLRILTTDRILQEGLVGPGQKRNREVPTSHDNNVQKNADGAVTGPELPLASKRPSVGGPNAETSPSYRPQPIRPPPQSNFYGTASPEQPTFPCFRYPCLDAQLLLTLPPATSRPTAGAPGFTALPATSSSNPSPCGASPRGGRPSPRSSDPHPPCMDAAPAPVHSTAAFAPASPPDAAIQPPSSRLRPAGNPPAAIPGAALAPTSPPAFPAVPSLPPHASGPAVCGSWPLFVVPAPRPASAGGAARVDELAHAAAPTGAACRSASAAAMAAPAPRSHGELYPGGKPQPLSQGGSAGVSPAANTIMMAAPSAACADGPASPRCFRRSTGGAPCSVGATEPQSVAAPAAAPHSAAKATTGPGASRPASPRGRLGAVPEGAAEAEAADLEECASRDCREDAASPALPACADPHLHPLPFAQPQLPFPPLPLPLPSPLSHPLEPQHQPACAGTGCTCDDLPCVLRAKAYAASLAATHWGAAAQSSPGTAPRPSDGVASGVRAGHPQGCTADAAAAAGAAARSVAAWQQPPRRLPVHMQSAAAPITAAMEATALGLGATAAVLPAPTAMPAAWCQPSRNAYAPASSGGPEHPQQGLEPPGAYHAVRRRQAYPSYYHPYYAYHQSPYYHPYYRVVRGGPAAGPPPLVMRAAGLPPPPPPGCTWPPPTFPQAPPGVTRGRPGPHGCWPYPACYQSQAGGGRQGVASNADAAAAATAAAAGVASPQVDGDTEVESPPPRVGLQGPQPEQPEEDGYAAHTYPYGADAGCYPYSCPCYYPVRARPPYPPALLQPPSQPPLRLRRPSSPPHVPLALSSRSGIPRVCAPPRSEALMPVAMPPTPLPGPLGSRRSDGSYVPGAATFVPAHNAYEYPGPGMLFGRDSSGSEPCAPAAAAAAAVGVLAAPRDLRL